MELKQTVLLLLPFLLLLVSSNSVSSSSLDSSSSSNLNNKNLKLVVDALSPYRTHIQQWTTLEASSSSTPLLNCGLCKTLVSIARQLVKVVTHEEATELVITACAILDLAPKDEICRPIITAYADQFLYILENKSSASSNGTELCALLTPSSCTASDHPNMVDWDVKLTGNGTDFNWIKDASSSVKKTTKIFQVTDVHLDLHYVEGTSTTCGDRMPLCCRPEYGFVNGDGGGARKFGEKTCALNYNGYVALLEDIKKRVTDGGDDHKPPFMLLTGDYTHSAVWTYNVQENSNHITNVTNTMLHLLSPLTNAIYPVVGNHEPHVVNMYAPKELWEVNDNFSLKWLYNTTLTPFLKYYPKLLSNEEIDRFLSYGYYTASPVKGLRLVVLNTNLCYLENFWLGYDAKDPGGQLEWVAKVLEQAEKQSESVLVVGHVEPGSCFGYWSSRWNKVVERFRGVIRGQFYGHAHKPHFRVGFIQGTTTPLSVSFIGGSALPDKMNPGYSIYELDGERDEQSTWVVLNQQLVVMDLNQSNVAGAPVMDVIDTREHLGIRDLQPASVWEWVKSLVCDQGSVDGYLDYHNKRNGTVKGRCVVGKDRDCMTQLLCGLVGSNAEDDTACLKIGNIVGVSDCDGNVNGRGTTTGVVKETVLLMLVIGLLLSN